VKTYEQLGAEATRHARTVARLVTDSFAEALEDRERPLAVDEKDLLFLKIMTAVRASFIAGAEAAHEGVH